MKKVKFINILLLAMFSFSILHSFVLEEDYHHSDAKEWVSEFSHISHSDIEDVHDLHCEFHHSYILTQNFTSISNKLTSQSPIFQPKFYIYHKTDNFLKPPIA